MSPKLQASKGGRVEEDRDERTRVEASEGSFAGSRRRLDVGGSGGADGGELSAGEAAVEAISGGGAAGAGAWQRGAGVEPGEAEEATATGSTADPDEVQRGAGETLWADASSGATLCRMGEEETIWAAVGVLQAWIERYGVPQVLYTDWKNIYVPGPREEVRLQGEVAETQVGRMCRRLGIRIIAAHSPQAKGRV